MSELGAFQDAFAAALAEGFAPVSAWTSGADAEVRFSVYRNTVAKGCADVLIAQFPTVTRVVGEAWMSQAGVLFSRAQPPSSASLLNFGAGFPDWLGGFEPVAEMPWLPGLARIDWAWRDAYFAPDIAPLSAETLTRLAPEAYATVAARLHPAAAVLSFDDGTPGLWLALQGAEAPDEAELAPDPQSLLLTRPGLDVRYRLLAPGEVAFLQACQTGRSLAQAAQAALAAQSDLPLAAAFAELIAIGAFADLQPLAGPETAE